MLSSSAWWKPYNPDAWVDKKSMKTGYQIPFTRTFYHYQELEAVDVIAERILQHENSREEPLRLCSEGTINYARA